MARFSMKTYMKTHSSIVMPLTKVQYNYIKLNSHGNPPIYTHNSHSPSHSYSYTSSRLRNRHSSFDIAFRKSRPWASLHGCAGWPEALNGEEVSCRGRGAILILILSASLNTHQWQRDNLIAPSRDWFLFEKWWDWSWFDFLGEEKCLGGSKKKKKKSSHMKLLVRNIFVLHDELIWDKYING